MIKLIERLFRHINQASVTIRPVIADSPKNQPIAFACYVQQFVDRWEMPAGFVPVWLFSGNELKIVQN